MNSVLVTGGFGFVGSHLVDYLIKEGKKVVVIDNSTAKGGIIYKNPHSTNIELSLTEKESFDALEKFSFDTIFHLAAQTSGEDSQSNSLEDIKNNAYATLNIVNFAKRKNVNRFAYMSTSAVYGSSCKTIVDEESVIAPDSVYGVTKHAGELFVKQVLKDSKTTYTIFRLTNSFGPGENINYNKKGMVSIFSGMAWRKEDIVVKGSLDRVRNFLYVKDVVKALIMSQKKEANNQTFLLSTGKKVTVGELISCIIKSFKLKYDYPIRVLQERTSGDTDVFHANTEKINKLLGWFPEYSLESALEEYVEWINKIPVGQENLSEFHPLKIEENK